MAPSRDVVVILGSLRKESHSRKLATAFSTLVPPELSLSIVELRELAMYDQDLDEALALTGLLVTVLLEAGIGVTLGSRWGSSHVVDGPDVLAVDGDGGDAEPLGLPEDRRNTPAPRSSSRCQPRL